MVLESLVFPPNNSLAIKMKNLDKHIMKNWTPIEIQYIYIYIYRLLVITARTEKSKEK